MRRLTLNLALALLPLLIGAAGETPPRRNVDTPRPLVDVTRTATPPRIDASVDDPAWANAVVIPELTVAFGPQGAGRQALPTEIKLLWDADHLYVRFTNRGDNAAAPHGAEHDASHHEGDVSEVFLDPKGDGREFMELQVSPANGVLDKLYLLTAPAESDDDLLLRPEILKHDEWEFLEWTLEGFKTAAGPLMEGGKKAGWIADFSIPAKPVLKRLNATTFSPMTLRMNFIRYARPIGSQQKDESLCMNWGSIVWGRPHRSPAAMGSVRLVDRAATTQP